MFDADTGNEITQVLSVDTESREVVVIVNPIRIENGEIVTETLRFQSICMTYDERKFRLFHCYRRMNGSV